MTNFEEENTRGRHCGRFSIPYVILGNSLLIDKKILFIFNNFIGKYPYHVPILENLV